MPLSRLSPSFSLRPPISLFVPFRLALSHRMHARTTSDYTVAQLNCLRLLSSHITEQAARTHATTILLPLLLVPPPQRAVAATTALVLPPSRPPPHHPRAAAATTTTTDLTSYLVEHVQGCTHARCSVLHIADRFERAETARAHSLTAAASLAPKSAPSHTDTLALLPYSRACIQPHQLADCTKQSISPQRRVRLCGSL